ncbi:MAG: SRPBCC family protein [Acidimicrobiia bacterium]|nr:SRPBCC family protein [Acidimicrobiia bacterium]
MADEARESISVDAPLVAVFAVLVDLERYTEWVPDLKQVDVIERDDDGRGTLVEFRAAGLGRSTTYRLRYDYSDAPASMGWTLDGGDIQRAIDGSYRLEALDDDRTEVVYELAISLKVPVPGFVKRRAEERIMKSALHALRDRVETGDHESAVGEE